MKLALILIFLVPLCCASKILFLIPMPARSHFNLGDRLIRALTDRGHEVTLISVFQMSNPPKNLTEIQIPDMSSKFFGNQHPWEQSKEGKFSLRKLTPLKFLMFGSIGEAIVEGTMSSQSVQQLMNSDANFDVIIGECFLSDALLGGFSHKYKAPIIGLTTFIPNTWANEMVGNPASAAYIPEPILPYTHKMNFYERFLNLGYGLIAQLAHYFKYIPMQDKVMRKYFGNDVPLLKDLLSKTSLVLVNHHHSLAFPRPYVPNMVEIGGFHVKPPQPLPKDLEGFMNGAQDGVIFFSMGSNLQSSDFTEEKLQGILRAFSKLKQRVIWKFEKENIKNIPKNVKIGKWLPQNDILAHPKTKLFITHGGLLSLTEAVMRGIPVVGIPIFGDQPMNVNYIEEYEIGVRLEYDDISEGSLLQAINKVLSDPKYAKNMKYRSTLLQDLPMSPINTAIYWIEYVIRHKGAPHLRSAAQDLTWYELYLFDVYAFFCAVLGAIFYIFYKIINFFKALCCKKKPVAPQAKKIK